MAYAGVFPSPGEDVAEGPLTVSVCDECGLAQLAHDYDPSVFFGEGYGYRSALNASMVMHLQSITDHVEGYLSPGDTVVDIGANDGTLLGCYGMSLDLIGIDPLAIHFMASYPKHATLIPSLFDMKTAGRLAGKAKAVTSIACFYDLPSPLAFARDVMRMLSNDGVWVLEQSYLPAMCRQNAFDTICHEHFEFYTVRDIANICEQVNAKIIDLSFNDTNGGSFAVTVARKEAKYLALDISDTLEAEHVEGYGTVQPLRDMMERSDSMCIELTGLLLAMKQSGRRVLGYGASTKGNVLLQYCGIDLEAIVEVNADKFGKVTPGMQIPIIPEGEAPDAYLVLPWHFRDAIVKKEKDYLAKGGELIFPLPVLDIVT